MTLLQGSPCRAGEPHAVTAINRYSLHHRIATLHLKDMDEMERALKVSTNLKPSETQMMAWTEAQRQSVREMEGAVKQRSRDAAHAAAAGAQIHSPTSQLNLSRFSH